MNAPHPARLAARFTPALTPEQAQRLMDLPRFHDRIAALFGPDAEADTPADRVLIAMSRDALQQLAIQAGLVLHARRIVQEIRGPVIAQLVAQFGADALAQARAAVDLAADLPEDRDIQQDGMACLGAWLAQLPVALHQRVALQWPDDDSLPRCDDAQILSLGPRIMRRLAAGEQS